MTCEHDWVFAPYLNIRPRVDPYPSIDRICKICGLKSNIRAETTKPGTSEYYETIRKFSKADNPNGILEDSQIERMRTTVAPEPTNMQKVDSPIGLSVEGETPVTTEAPDKVLKVKTVKNPDVPEVKDEEEELHLL